MRQVFVFSEGKLPNFSFGYKSIDKFFNNGTVIIAATNGEVLTEGDF